jgi:hypothetical protein
MADSQCRGYSPIYERICHAVADDGPTLDLVDACPAPAGHMPNVLLGAVHFLLLGGLDHPLAAVYAGRSMADPAPLFLDVCRTHADEIAELLATRHTNTNEVGRSAFIGPALLAVADGRPLGLVDVGCSAGLNLRCDRYLLDYGSFGRIGPSDATVRLTTEVVGAAPPVADRLPVIGGRIGIDRHPVDVTDEADRRWQLACVWPDTGRIERTRLALEEARSVPVEVVAGDAVASVTEAVLGLPEECQPVVVTTFAFAYLSVEERSAFVDRLGEIGARRPLVWLSGEGRDTVAELGDVAVPAEPAGAEPAVLGAVRFDGGRLRAEVLAFVHPHGQWIDWRAG